MSRSVFPLLLVVIIVVLAVAPVAHAKAPAEWAKRRIYQVMTDRFARPQSDNSACDVNDYCGGTFSAMGDQLPYIAGMGFNAIWISPVVMNFPKGYHGYWATDFFAINPHFGTSDDLLNFVALAHSMDIWVMLDIVVNHVGPVGMDFSQVRPFNDSTHYHSDCQVTQYVCETLEVQHCRLANLPDLNQDVPFVTEQLAKYVVWLLTNFGFDGLRADTVMYIKNEYWVGLQQQVATYLVGEVWSDFACNLNYTQNGIDATLNYPLYYALRGVYQGQGSMNGLGDAWRQMKAFAHPNWEVNFLDNQDNDRFLTSGALVPTYKSAIAHMFFTNGIPCIYYGTEALFQGTVSNNENRAPLWTTGYPQTTMMYHFLKNLSAAHEQFKPWNHEVLERWRDDNIYCYIRGALLVCTTNQVGTAQTRSVPNLTFQGQTVCNWLDPSQPCVPGSSTMQITVPASGEPLILWGQ